MTLQIGEVIRDRYRIIQILASGGMGIVYRAKDESLGVDVALKESFPGIISAERMRSNASLLASLHHPGIPRITDTFELNDGTQILVMDFVPGEDLKDRVESSGPLLAGDAINLISSIGSALQYLHKQDPPIIHLDVKPGNIRIKPDGKAILIDFDLAVAIQGKQKRLATSERGLTPGFAAPEQYNHMATPQSDQYGLAATLYYALTGAMLPDGISRASGNSQLPEHTAARIPLDILTCLEKALQINPADRYSDIQSFLDALNSIIKTQPEISGLTTKKQRFAGKPIQNKYLIASAIGILMVAVLGMVGSFVFSSFQNAAEVNAPMKSQMAVVPSMQSAIPPVMATFPPALTTAIPTFTLPVTSVIKPTPLGGGSGLFAYVSEKTGIPQVFSGSTILVESTQMTNVPEGACQPDWAPNGKTIVFVSPCLPKSQITARKEPYSGAGLFLLSLETRQILPIPSKPGGDFDPAWSPDGKKIAFTSVRNQIPQIFLFDIAADSATQLTNTNFPNRQPVWSPDGTHLAFSSARTGTLQIWVMAADGSDQKVFTSQNGGAAFAADWSPDGKNLVYSQTNSQRLALKNYGKSNAEEIVLNPRLTNAYNPDISPDGQWILFDSNIENDFHVYRVSIKGSGMEPITPIGEKAYQPVWKPVSPD